MEIPKAFITDAIKLRHHLHQIPELQYAEKKTSALIAKTLQSYGYTTQEGIGKTGIVATLDSGNPGKTIAFRADIDALPIAEETGLSYQSTHPGCMHGCGHDGHSATLLLVARVLQQIKAQLKGKIKLIFQPAEEGGKGSTAMIQEGVLQNPLVAAIFGYHNWPGLPLHTVATKQGCVLAGSGRFEILLSGKRAHLSRPKEGINPVTLGAKIVQEIERLTIPNTIINMLGFNSGSWRQGTSEKTEIVGCYFVEGEEALSTLKKEIAALVGKQGTISFHEFQSPTINTLSETELVFAAAHKAKKQLQKLEHCYMASEDFAKYLEVVPGCFFFVGAGERASLHTPQYDFPDAILKTAAEILLQIALLH